MANEWYTMLGAIVLLGVWIFAEVRTKVRGRPPHHGRRVVVAVELDEDERAELRSVLASHLAGARIGIAGSDSRGPVDLSKRRAVAEKFLRQLE